MKYLVTGAAGFMGFHLAEALLNRGKIVVGLDNMNDFYNIKIKEHRLANLYKHNTFTFFRMDLCDFNNLQELFTRGGFNKVCHLAAQAGVRYSLENPCAYQRSNLEGFLGFYHRVIRLPNLEARDAAVEAVRQADIVGCNFMVPEARELGRQVLHAYAISPPLLFEAYLRG